MKHIGIFVFLISLFGSCESDTNAFADKENYEAQETADNSTEAAERRMIKTANIKLKVKNLKASAKNIENMTAKFSGFVAGMNQTDSNHTIDNRLTVKIPVEQLSEFMAAIEAESIRTDYTKIHTKDVTEEYIDLTSRLATKKEVRDRYIEILRNKAETVTDVLEAEQKIQTIQEDIESMEGKLKYLNNNTTFSTVTIHLYQKVKYVQKNNGPSFFSELGEGFVNGWKLIRHIVIGLVTVWPIVLILMFIFLMRKRLKNALEE